MERWVGGWTAFVFTTFSWNVCLVCIHALYLLRAIFHIFYFLRAIPYPYISCEMQFPVAILASVLP